MDCSSDKTREVRVGGREGEEKEREGRGGAPTRASRLATLKRSLSWEEEGTPARE